MKCSIFNTVIPRCLLDISSDKLETTPEYILNMVVVPHTLDISKLHGAERLAIAKQALEGFTRDGFIKIVGHGIPEDEITRLLSWVITES